jgi:hypothetical protein
MLRPLLPEFVIRKHSDRRKDVLLTYVDGEGKSGQYYASQYADENRISVECIKSPADFDSSVAEHIRVNGSAAAIVIIDDIAATGRSLARNAVAFIEKNKRAMGLSGPVVFVVTVIATIEADTRIREALSGIEASRADFRACEILDKSAYAFVSGNGIWESEHELDRAKALCIDLGINIYPESPLGFEDQGLLLVLPNTTPNNSLPILHSFSRASASKRWTPLFERVIN